MISNVFNKAGKDKGRSTPSALNTQSSGEHSIGDENINPDGDQRSRMSAFYFVKRSSFKAEEALKIKKNRQELRRSLQEKRPCLE